MNLDFITINVKDIKLTIEFYSQVAGFVIEREFSPRPEVQIVFMKDLVGRQVEFIQAPDAKVFKGEGVSLGFYSNDIEATAKFLQECHVPALSGPTGTKDSPVRFLSCQDPDGFPLSFVQMKQRRSEFRTEANKNERMTLIVTCA